LSTYTPLSYRTSVTADLEQISQDVFRIDRIIVPSQVAPSFEINGIWINGRNQLAAVDAIPAAVFAVTLIDNFIDNFVSFDAVPAGKSIRIRVTYTGESDDGEQFMACLLGTSYRSAPQIPSVLELSARSSINFASRVLMGARRAQLTAIVEGRGSGFTAYCESIGAVVQATSYEEAKSWLAIRIAEIVATGRDGTRHGCGIGDAGPFRVTIVDLGQPQRVRGDAWGGVRQVVVQSNNPIALAACVARHQRFARAGRPALISPELAGSP
jgi:hypothetical protein